MRILFINTFYPPDVGGGAELTLATLARAMQTRGHDVHVVATTDAASIVDETVGGIPVSRVPLRNIYWHRSDDRKGALMRAVWHARDARNRAMGKSVAAQIERHRPDVVSLHNMVGFSVAAWEAVHASGTPAVQVLHDYYHLCARSQLFRGGRNCVGQCGSCRVLRRGRAQASDRLQAVVGVSRAVLDAHMARGLFHGTPIRRVVHNARQFDRLPEARAHRPAARTFGFIGTIAEWKGIRALLDAFVALRAAVPADVRSGLRLLVGGSGDADYVAALRETYRDAGVEFLGRVEPAAFFARIDVSVVPSIWHDPLPGVVFESLLFGVPVIGARRGGIPEMVEDDVNGLVYDPDDAGALTACMKRLVEDDGLLPRMGAAAQAGAGPYASIDRMAAEHEAVYGAVAGVGSSV